MMIAGCQSTSWPLTASHPGAVDDDQIARGQSAADSDSKPTFLDRLILGKGKPVSWGWKGAGSAAGKATSQSSPLDRREAADRELLQNAQTRYENGDYAGASELFAVVAKERNPKRFRLFSSSRRQRRPVYDPVREEAVFFMAESQFMQDRLVSAQEYYQLLVKEFPQSRYLDESTRRLFDIAQRWLGVEEFATPGEIQQVSFDGTRDKSLSTVDSNRKRFGWLPNLTDPSRPVVDTSGRAVAALKTIWLNDPTGPLADDALMLAATHHLRAGKYRESARLLKILREEFPKSPHLQTAFVIGSKVELMSYQGSSYDDRKLLEAKALSESSLRLFPGLDDGDRLRRELKRIDEEQARREWDRVILWEKKNKPKAVAVYCRELIRNYPRSSYAPKAQQKLAALGISSDQPAVAGRVQLSSPDDSLQPFVSQPATTDDEGPVFETTTPVVEPPTPAQTPPAVPAGRARL